MSNPIDTLIGLTRILEDLNHVQNRIDQIREACPDNQQIQLEMDRKQVTIDNRREFVLTAMQFYSSLN